MQRVELKNLEDILMAINEIQEFISGNKKFSYYVENKMLRRAIERNFEIIGEASKRLKRRNPLIKISNITGIISLRNILAHEYDFVKDEMIWSIIIKHLPKLKLEIEKMIKVGEKKYRTNLKKKE